MVFEINIKDEHEFFRPRLEEELKGVLIFETKEELIKATKIYDKLILEFKYDIEINRLEELLIDNGVFPDYDKILSKEVYEEYIITIGLVKNLTYKDFMNNYEGYHKKLDYKLHCIKQRIISSDNYKIKKLNLLKKELNKYNILS